MRVSRTLGQYDVFYTTGARVATVLEIMFKLVGWTVAKVFYLIVNVNGVFNNGEG